MTRAFAGREVVRALDLEVAAGERIALRGPNGSGKTTVLRCITGALEPTGGEVRVGTHRAGTEGAKHLVGASLAQERSFYLRLSGRENLIFFATMRHGDRRRAAAQVRELEEELKIRAITAKRLDRCSSGMLQQVGLARALLGTPRLLLLDEPTRSLDRDAVGRLWAALDRRPDTGVVMATHHDDDIARCHSSIELGA